MAGTPFGAPSGRRVESASGGVRSDPESLARFRRKAQVLASLNHPNIAHVYGFEQANGVQALVIELVEGPTLADRMSAGSQLEARTNYLIGNDRTKWRTGVKNYDSVRHASVYPGMPSQLWEFSAPR